MRSRLAFAVTIAVLVTGTAFHFAKTWLPAPVNTFGRDFDAGLRLNFVLLGIVFVATQVALGALVWRFREARPVAAHQPSQATELFWMAAASLLFIGLAVTTAVSWEKDKPLGAASSQTLQVEAVGQQFRWYFRYVGHDGKFGATDLKFADAAEGNPLGLVRTDPSATDDVVATTLVLPAAREIELRLRSYDVIHSFFIPELRFKQDAVPGMEIPVHFRIERTGDYEIACAELCGLGHHQMTAKVTVLSPEAFARWEAGH